MDLVKVIEKRIDAGNTTAKQVRQPVRISYRDRYKHPVRYITEIRPDKRENIV